MADLAADQGLPESAVASKPKRNPKEPKEPKEPEVVVERRVRRNKPNLARLASGVWVEEE